MPVLSETELNALLHHKKEQLLTHPVFRKIRKIDDLRQFMQWHVFAVWDFMSLVKRLQTEFTSVSLPWCPPASASASRLINDIVLAEESDETNDGAHASHFELYRHAMIEVGADTTQIDTFIDLVRSGTSYQDALITVDAPLSIRRFVTSTMTCAIEGQTVAALGSFLNGREDSIPGMFTSLLTQWHIGSEQAPTFVYYLKRHIDLDGNTHGPAAEHLVKEYVGNNQQAFVEYLESSIEAVSQRIDLWNELGVALDRQTDELLAPEEELAPAKMSGTLAAS